MNNTTPPNARETVIRLQKIARRAKFTEREIRWLANAAMDDDAPRGLLEKLISLEEAILAARRYDTAVRANTAALGGK